MGGLADSNFAAQIAERPLTLASLDLSPARGEVNKQIRSRDALSHPSHAQATLKKATRKKSSSPKRREAERRQTHPTGDRIAADKFTQSAQTVRHAARALFSFLPRLWGRIKEGGTLAFRRSTAAFEAVTPRPDPGPRFLEPPGANGRTLPGTSAASTSRSGHVPDGTMPRAARRGS